MEGGILETRRQARFAGILYMLVGVTAPIGFLVVPGRLIVTGDAGGTADRIRASEWLLRLGLGTELFHQAVAVFLVLALYRLFKPVDAHLARHVVALGALVSVPIVFANALNQIAALTLVGAPPFLTAAFSPHQLDALAYFFLRLHDRGITVASIFWGLWLFPFGLLVMRSGFIPRVLGILLMIAGTGYVASAFTTLCLPAFADVMGWVGLIAAFGELPIMFWLLIWGARPLKAAIAAA